MISPSVSHDPSSRAIRSQIETNAFWPTPTVTVRLEEAEAFNARLAAIILEHEAKIRATSAPTAVAGISDGLTAYWQSFNVLNWDDPAIRTFRGFVLTGLSEWMRTIGDPASADLQVAGISCWANVLRYGERLTLHHHDPAFVSAHYTVQSGFEDGGPPGSVDSGHTVYYRPGFADRSHGGDASVAASPWDDDWAIGHAAAPGRLFFFPSFIRHEVRPYLGRAQRISIAMDVFLKRQRLPIHFGGPRWFVPDHERTR
jgi:hypothetical protein